MSDGQSSRVIYYDDRERGEAVAAAMASESRVSWHCARLSIGDYVIPFDNAWAVGSSRMVGDQFVAVERKTTHDFGVSLRDGRLFGQAARLAESYAHRFMILEGPYDPANQNVDGPSGRGAQIALTTRWGLPILRTASADESIQSLVYLTRQLNNGSHSVAAVGRRRPRTLRARKLRVLQSLPGIGPKRAHELLKHYGTVASVATASRDALAMLPGMGPAVAGQIYEALHEPACSLREVASPAVSPPNHQ